MNKSEIVKILIRRDKMSRQDAMELVQIAQEEIDEILEHATGDLDAVEQVIQDTLGLEPDYVMAFLT